MKNFVLPFLLGFPWVGCGGPVDKSVVIGSKNFTEQIILGELLAQYVEAKTELRVDRRLNLGGTFICDRALRAGAIDLYVEYTGTALTAILKQAPLQDPDEVYRLVKREYGQFGVEWMQPLGFNNTFAILIRNSDAEDLQVKTISEISPYTPEWDAGFGYEFIERADGFKGLSETYGLRFRGPPRVMELGLIYRSLAEGQVDLIAGNSTSGLIRALDLFVLADDKRYFPPYHAAPLARTEVLGLFPELRVALDGLENFITETEMREMNYRVERLAQNVRTVVSAFLAQKRGMVGSAGAAAPSPARIGRHRPFSAARQEMPAGLAESPH